MDEQERKRDRGFGRIVWLLVLAAILILWFYFKPGPDKVANLAQEREDAALAASDPDDILIDLRDHATRTQVAQIEADFDISLQLVDDTGEAEATQLYRAHVKPAQRDAILAQLKTRPEVEVAEPDALYGLLPGDEIASAPAPTPAEPGYPNDPQYKFQWHLNQIGMPAAWKLADGNGVVVAILDTGVGYENYKQFKLLPDLEGVTFVDPYDFVGKTTHAVDDHGHGSHVAGTIAQVTNNGIGVAGIARNVKIMPLKVLSAAGSGSVAGIADAIRYAADHGAKVINMSLGGAFPSTVLKKAVAYAHDKGVTVVCAAGNDGKGKVGYPAAYPGAIAVAATQFDEATTFYSNWGKEIDIAAPGGNTRIDQNGDGQPDGVLQNTLTPGKPSENGYYAYMGTSMASPHVAGVAALVVGEGVTTPNMVEYVLKASARKPSVNYTPEHYGAGILDAPAAVLKARSSTGGWQLGLGALMAGALALTTRRRIKIGAGYLAGTVLGASGLAFLPYLAPSLSSKPVFHMLTVGLPSWDMSVLGAGSHGSWLFFSALIPLALVALGYGFSRLRGLLAGLSIGVAAHLAFFAVVPMTAGVGAAWLAVNAIACLGLARVALRR